MFKKLYKLFYLITHEQYYGFVQGHSYLTEENILILSNMVKNFNSYEQIIKRYENEFTSLIGTGYGLSFAAGRMAFYSLMKVLNIGQGDEVILQGSTCSVMPNAVLRTGAKPVFADIDKDTFGSSAAEIEKKITPNTKLIVAQHSFGIPCKIDEIVALGRRENIFVLEDCAISFDSSIDGKKVGNWGDAAIFSTDHSKPINTLIGGFLYTKSKELYYKIQNYQENIPNLKSAHQKRLFKQLLWERKFYNPPKYAYGMVLNILKRKLFSRNNAFTFLEADYSNNPSDENSSYPYPAKLPPFLAQLGIYELKRWQDEKKQRIELLDEFIKISKEKNIYQYLPNAYSDKKFEIVPLRFVFAHRDFELIKKKMSRYIDVSSFWFQRPIIVCDDPEEFGYTYGSCKISEILGQEVINWPCVLDHKYHMQILKIFREVFSF